MSTKAENYYYNQLNKEQKKVYYAMKEGLLKMQDSFPVLKLSNRELADIYFMVRMDCPEIFYSVKFTYRYYQDSMAVELVPEYLFTKDKIKEHRQAMQSRVKKLARQAEKLDEKGKELFIHDFIVNNVKYDKLKKEYSHEKNKVLLFHWRGGYLTKDILKELLEVFDEEAKVKGKQAYVSVNWPQAVLRVRFKDGAGEEQLEMEEANEGERE